MAAAKWDCYAAMMWMTAEINRNHKDHPEPFHPDQFNPLVPPPPKRMVKGTAAVDLLIARFAAKPEAHHG
jgi:hypothetical protein